ncbi:MAG: hypothetical protein AYK22_04725 [Thermoplasmatales archaeon SG8-52-3]|nr:MAG: hypothetical protein AYK22_04725 [Thermoplasmatales archaeon SG8-52-3]
MVDFDVHTTNHRIDRALLMLEKSDILDKNRELITEFHEYAFSIGLTKMRVIKYVDTLRKLSGWLGVEFNKASKKDIFRLVREIEQKDYSEWTKHDYKVILKRFYKWLNGNEKYPENVEWVRTTFKKKNSKLPEELIGVEDVKKMINTAGHPRDKALVSLLYESGCRISEILNMRIKHLEFDEYGAKIIVNGKTGMRKIPIVSSTPSLAAWYEIHPSRDNPNAPLWVSIGTRNKGEPIKYHVVRGMLANLARKTGLKKRVHPHLFRHSRATHIASHFTEAQMNQYFGWIQGSEMPSTYVHLSGRDINEAVYRLNGLVKKDEDTKEKFSTKQCHRCEKVNPPTGKFCNRCGATLDLETAMNIEEKTKEVDEATDVLLKDPEFLNLLVSKIKQMNIQI